MMKKKIFSTAVLLFFLSILPLHAQEIVQLPSLGCGRLLDVNKFGADRGAEGTILNPGTCRARIGRVAENPSAMADPNVNSYGRLNVGIGAAISCRMFLAAYRDDGVKFPAQKPIYVDIEAQGFNFNASINNANVVFYNGSSLVSRQSIGGKFFFDFGGNAARKLVKFIPPAQWDRIEIETREFAGIGFTFSEIKVYNIFSEFYRLQNLIFNQQPTDKTVIVGGNTNMQANIVINDEIPIPILYQWQVNTAGSWGNLQNNGIYSGVNTPSLQINNIPANFDDNRYRLTAQSKFGTCLFNGTSNEALLRVNFVSGGEISANQALCIGKDDDPAAFIQITAASGLGNLAYQWESSPNNVSFTAISGATALLYDPPPGIVQTTYYRRKVSSTLNSTVVSAYTNVLNVSVVKCYLDCIISNKMTTTLLKN
ncbi:hypothetical protein [Chryseobacterium sp. MEBOG07]|uniref:hypothetical protein n=1 Tax=Chryseobacterium sp. MEBOG07 TaxID=2879939 RepID=UPI001F40978A|nr:hypothetical protein [Chryseobacterium sp. MEBOG07]UKB81634.1 hypothetical protein LF886_11800 [Chryseobacterium sp. MEBOG07]